MKDCVNNVHWTPLAIANVIPFPLTEEQKKYLIEITKSESNPGKDRFLRYVELIIGAYKAHQELDKSASLSKTRARIQHLQKSSEGLLKAIQNLEEASINLLLEQGRGPEWHRPSTIEIDGVIHQGAMPDGSPIKETCKGYTLEEMTIAVSQLSDMSDKIIRNLEIYSNKSIDWSKRHLALDIKTALTYILDIDVDSMPHGIFSNTLREIMHYAAIPAKKEVDHHTSRDVRSLIEYALGDHPPQ